MTSTGMEFGKKTFKEESQLISSDSSMDRDAEHKGYQSAHKNNVKDNQKGPLKKGDWGYLKKDVSKVFKKMLTTHSVKNIHNGNGHHGMNGDGKTIGGSFAYST